MSDKLSQAEDAAIDAFLDLLEADILANPENLVPLTDSIMKSLEALVDGVEVNLDQKLPPDDQERPNTSGGNSDIDHTPD